MTGNSQNGFTKPKKCLTNVSVFYDKGLHLWMKREVSMICLDFSKSLNTVSCNILTEVRTL